MIHVIICRNISSISYPPFTSIDVCVTILVYHQLLDKRESLVFTDHDPRSFFLYLYLINSPPRLPVTFSLALPLGLLPFIFHDVTALSFLPFLSHDLWPPAYGFSQIPYVAAGTRPQAASHEVGCGKFRVSREPDRDQLSTICFLVVLGHLAWDPKGGSPKLGFFLFFSNSFLTSQKR